MQSCKPELCCINFASGFIYILSVSWVTPPPIKKWKEYEWKQRNEWEKRREGDIKSRITYNIIKHVHVVLHLGGNVPCLLQYSSIVFSSIYSHVLLDNVPLTN